MGLLWRRPGEFSTKKSFFIEGLWGPQGAARAETNVTRMIFELVASEKMSNRSIKVVLSALHDSFEVGALQQSKTAHMTSPVPALWFCFMPYERFCFMPYKRLGLSCERFCSAGAPRLQTCRSVCPDRLRSIGWTLFLTPSTQKSLWWRLFPDYLSLEPPNKKTFFCRKFAAELPNLRIRLTWRKRDATADDVQCFLKSFYLM